MRAVIRRNKQLVCDEVADLSPGPGRDPGQRRLRDGLRSYCGHRLRP